MTGCRKAATLLPEREHAPGIGSGEAQRGMKGISKALMPWLALLGS